MNPDYQVQEVMVSSLAGYLSQGWKIVGSPYTRSMNGFDSTYILLVKQN